ncbi:membrane protein [Natranaerovirga pectinivora]|uniref:Membrane protein n=1 Tax=Natranaerovirga pectinivora TaxID=682400 RepID=A0A4R3MKW9_9FIRM|nr:YihY/virulence factor BrkB family protein [Natranaerovirga pectinivora]TCT15356.1 membrane protein [Natranaerovirga pectinivora]
MIRKLISFIFQLQRRVTEDNISALSAQLTYFLLLSFFPFVMFLLTILSYTPITQQEVVLSIGEIFPGDIGNIIVAILNEIAINKSNALLSITVILTIWSASKGVLAIVRSLNIAYRIDETRSFVHLKIISCFYTIIFATIILLTFILVIFGNNLLSLLVTYFPATLNIVGLLQLIRYIFIIFILLIFFTVIYNAIPNRKISLSEAIPGALFSSVGWIALSISFSFYVDNFGNFSYMYGSLAGVIVLLLWLYICSNIIMIGGEINALLVEHKEKRNNKKTISSN